MSMCARKRWGRSEFCSGVSVPSLYPHCTARQNHFWTFPIWSACVMVSNIHARAIGTPSLQKHPRQLCNPHNLSSDPRELALFIQLKDSGLIIPKCNFPFPPSQEEGIQVRIVKGQNFLDFLPAGETCLDPALACILI